MISKLEIGDLNLEMGEFDIVKLVQNVLTCSKWKASKKDILLMFMAWTHNGLWWWRQNSASGYESGCEFYKMVNSRAQLK
jgi:hypothetical protein